MKKIKVNEGVAVFLGINFLAIIILIVGYLITGLIDTSMLPLFFIIINGCILFSGIIVGGIMFLDRYIEITEFNFTKKQHNTNLKKC